MKTSAQFSKKQKKPLLNSHNNDGKLLIDKPQHDYLLNVHTKAVKNDAEFLQDLIRFKAERRKRQKESSFLFFSIGLCISILVAIVAFEWPFYEEGNVVDLSLPQVVEDDFIDVPLTEQPPPPPPKVQQPQLVEVANDVEIIEEIEFTLDVEMTEESKVEEQPVITGIGEEPVEETTEEIFTIVENQPEPVGGLAAFYNYVGENLKYPQKALRLGIEGRVFVQFVVERDGSLTDVQVIRGIGADCDEEAVRIVANAPKWTPGKQRGRPVRVRMVLPIQFKIYQM